MKNKLLLLLFFIFIHLSGLSKDVYFKHLSLVDGLSLQSTISIWQDQLGNMWFGNDVLNKYNGSNLKTYRLSDYLEGIKDSNIKQICGDNTTLLYILADTEIVVYDARHDKFAKTSIEADYIFSSVDQTLFYTKANSLYSYDFKNNISSKISDINNSIKSIKSVIISGDGKIWLGTDKGLFVTCNDKTETIIGDINVSCLFEDSNNNIWVGTVNDGVRVVEKKSSAVSVFKEEQASSSNVKLANNRIRCFCEDDKQNIWIGTYRGITIYSLETKESFNLTHNESAFYSLRHNSIYSIYKDRQGTIWVGSYYGGVSYFNPVMELYRFYGTSNIDSSMLSGFIIGDMTEDGIGNLYIATEEGGLNILNPNTGSIKIYDTSNSNLPHNTIKSIWYDKKYKRLYIGTFTEGLWYRSQNSQSFNKVSNTVLSTNAQNVISQIVPYNDEYIIVSTQDNVYKLNRKNLELTTLISSSSLDSNTIGIIQTMFVDSDENLWISSERGLFYLNLKTFKMQHFDNLRIGMNADKTNIRQIQEGPDGKIYLLSRSYFLSFDKSSQQFRILNENNNLLFSNNYYNMACLSSGRFIITADKGITILDPVSLSFLHLPFA